MRLTIVREVPAHLFSRFKCVAIAVVPHDLLFAGDRVFCTISAVKNFIIASDAIKLKALPPPPAAAL